MLAIISTVGGKHFFYGVELGNLQTQKVMVRRWWEGIKETKSRPLNQWGAQWRKVKGFLIPLVHSNQNLGLYFLRNLYANPGRIYKLNANRVLVWIRHFTTIQYWDPFVMTVIWHDFPTSLVTSQCRFRNKSLLIYSN